MQLSFEQLILHLADRVKNGTFHQDHKRTVELSVLYKQLITGHDIDSLMLQFVTREDDSQFDQRKRITQTVFPAVSEKIMSPFNKVSRMDNVIKKIDFAGDSKNENLTKLNDSLSTFWGDDDLDSYMETRFIELVFCDPNAFILVEFDDFNSDIETAKPYPVEIMSKDVVDFSYRNNTLDWLIYRKPYCRTYVDSMGVSKTVNEFEYFLYTKTKQVRLRRTESIGTKQLPVNELGELINTSFVLEQEGRYNFEVEVFDPKVDMVQGVRVGYKRDLVTDGRTCLSPLHPAVNRMKRTLKTGSEFDLTMTLHAFPQKFQYVKPCVGSDENKCRSGKTNDGNNCKSCKGTGYQIHTSAQDSVLLPIPRTPEQMMDLTKLTHYSSPDIGLVKFQEDYLRRLEADAVKDVFSSDTFNRDTIVGTATEVVIDMQSVYDTLFPFAKKFSAVYRKLVGLTAIFTDNLNGLVVVHSFPKDFKLKTTDALLNDLKQAKESGAPSFIRMELANDIAGKIWTDEPEKLKEHKVKQCHLPFSGKSTDEVILIQANGTATRSDIILWSNFDAIIKDIELEQMDKGVNFFDMAYQLRETLIDEKVKQYIEKIDSEQSTATEFNIGE